MFSKSVVKTKLKATGVHLAMSLMVFIYLAYQVFFNWYPEPYFSIDGGWQGMRLIGAVDLVLGGPLQFNTVFGYTPTVAGRFNGMGNPAFSMLTAAGIILSALIAHRVPGRRGTWLGIAVLGWCVVLDGAPFLGADVGGALTLIPSAGVTAWMLLGWRINQSAAEDLLWSGRSIDGSTALAMGLVQTLADDPEAAALAYFDGHLLPRSAAALAAAVQAVRAPRVRELRQRLAEVEKLYLEGLMKTHDANEGLAAFMARRTPAWEHR